jgi:hypothetical protein
MTLTPEQARAEANATLAAMYKTVTDWDTALLDQAILAIASDGQPFGMNDVRTVLPEDACKRAGLYFHSLIALESPLILRPVGEVPSVNPKAHGKKVGIYRLTGAGRKFLADRRAARIKQTEVAA